MFCAKDGPTLHSWTAPPTPSPICADPITWAMCAIGVIPAPNERLDERGCFAHNQPRIGS
jgi:hypothetical protein